MGRLSNTEKEHFVTEALTSLNDLCTIHRKTGETKNEYNDRIPAYTDEEEVPCGLSHPNMGKASFQNELGQAVVIQVDALLRLSLDTELSIEDEITAREKRYNIDGIYRGQTLKIAALKFLETEEQNG